MKNSPPTVPGRIAVIDCGSSRAISGTGEETTEYTTGSSPEASAARRSSRANNPLSEDIRRVITGPAGCTAAVEKSNRICMGSMGGVAKLGIERHLVSCSRSPYLMRPARHRYLGILSLQVQTRG